MPKLRGMGAPPSKVEITIRDRQHGYETVGITMPSQKTIIVVHNENSVTHGFALTLFKDLPVRVENGKEVKGKNFRSFHVEPGHTMTLEFSTAPTKFWHYGGAESIRHAIWCDIHPEVEGEIYVIETRGEGWWWLKSCRWGGRVSLLNTRLRRGVGCLVTSRGVDPS